MKTTNKQMMSLMLKDLQNFQHYLWQNGSNVEFDIFIDRKHNIQSELCDVENLDSTYKVLILSIHKSIDDNRNKLKDYLDYARKLSKIEDK